MIGLVQHTTCGVSR